MRSDESIAIVICPECQARGKIKAEMIGRTATCPRCGKRVVLRREDETKTGLTAIEADDYRPQAARQPLVQPPV